MKIYPSGRRSQGGFSLVELLIVVAIIMIIAAVALPNMAQYIRTYKIRGAAREVTGELQAARSKAIMSNTNAGVLFVVIDADSYRLIQEDLPVADQLGTLKDLPEGIEFEPSSDTSDGYSVRFNRLGNYCNPIDSSCDDPPTDVCSPSEITQRCSYNADGAYVETNDSPAGSVAVTLWERSTDLRTSVRLVPGGRVLQFPGWED